MPGENIQDWSTAAANNGTADSAINWAEGQPRNTVNNSARSMMAAIAKDRNLQNSSIVTGGSANAQTFFSGLNYTAPIPTGLRVLLKIGPSLTNTAAVTLEMDGLGPVAIKDQLGADLAAGAIVADTRVEFIYSGTNWILLAAMTAPTAALGDNDTTIANTAFVQAAIADAQATKSAFVATMGGTDQVSWPAANWIVGLFTTEVVDIGSHYNTALQLWQPPAGRVIVGGQGYFSNMTAGSYASIGIYKNSVLFRQMIAPAILTVANMQITTEDTANGTDFYQLFFNPAAVGGGGATLNGSPINSVFYGHMV